MSLTNGALTYLASGTCTIQASQAADTQTATRSTTATTSFTVTAPPAYAVTFNGNGSTTGSTATETNNVPTALSLNGFSRTGYAFSGWNTVALGGGTSYADGAIYPFAATVTSTPSGQPTPPTPSPSMATARPRDRPPPRRTTCRPP